MNRKANKLFDIEIDEVSVVDRPANQHGLIAFAKNDDGADNAEGAMPELFDEAGDSVPVDVLENGDVVYDAEGNEFVFVEDEDTEDDTEESDDVEKGMFDEGLKAAKGLRIGSLRNAASAFKTSNDRGLKQGMNFAGRTQRALGAAYKNSPGAVLATGGAAGALGVGGMALSGKKDEMSKSLGDSVLEELSKAVTERDREAIIAKAMDEVEIAKAQAAEAYEYASALEDARITDAFISKAAEYNLPVAPEVFGPILKSIAEALTEDELNLLDELFSAIGESLYDELGYAGDTSNSSVLDTVSGMASEFVGKSDVSYEQAFTAMFESNPEAYDAYIAENGR
jgi:hypothetical protein